MSTKLYILFRDIKNYDEAIGFVVRAFDEEEARELAAQQHASEGRAVWLDPYYVSCRELKCEGVPQVILRDFVGS